MSEYQEAYQKTKLKLELLEQKQKLESEIRLLESEVKKLKIIAHNEQADVESLKSGAAGFFLKITGKKQARLEKKQAEARSARENYEIVLARQESALHKLSKCSEELADLAACEEDMRRLLNISTDTILATLTRCTEDLPKIQEQLRTAIEQLSKVDKLGAFRNGTQSTSALAGTDDRLMAAERQAQEILLLLKGDLKNFQADIAPFGLHLNIDELQEIRDDYLVDLYTYAIITTRVEKIAVILRQTSFRLDAVKPKLEHLKAEQQKKHLRFLLDAASLK